MSASPPSVPDWLLRLEADARRVDGSPPFSDQSLVELRDGRRRLVARGELAAALVSADEVEFAVAPDARQRGHGTALLAQLLDEQPHGTRFWAHGNLPGARALARNSGLEPVRTLLRLRAPVPKPDAAHPAATSPVRITPFRGGTGDREGAGTGNGDGEAWLRVNARAFAGHPEQGRVSTDDLAALMAEPWFDPDDLLLAWDGDALVGFCWLKVERGDEHESTTTGEFYVVGVDPGAQGRGLGRMLVEAGFERLASRDIRSTTLYVEGDNAPALALYRSFGFVDDAIDVQYARA